LARVYLANECVERAAAICAGGEVLSEDVRDLMMITGYRVSGTDDGEPFSLSEARAAVRAVYGDPAR
jgi:hypothetical protein